MAVTTTVQNVLNGAYGRSKKNQPNQIASEGTELIEVVDRAMRGIYAFAARINPTYFGATSLAVAFGTTGWARPDGAESVWAIKDNADSS
jgi:hypothetical protein